MTVLNTFNFLLFCTLWLCVTTTTWAQQHAQTNPFLIRRQKLRQQQQHQIELKKLQLHMKQPSLPPKQPSHQDPPPPPPSPPYPQQQANLSPPISAPRPVVNPFSPPQHGFRKKPSPKMKEREKGENRNEMHKGLVDGRPGPTPWTRWTSRPHSRSNPWQAQQHIGPEDLSTCGNRRYNPREHICCQDKLQDRQGLRPACCGSESFDFVFSLCCQGQVTPRTATKPFC